MFILSRYYMKMLEKDGRRYELTSHYDDEDLDNTIYDMLSEIDSVSDRRNCFIEADVTALDDSERSW